MSQEKTQVKDVPNFPNGFRSWMETYYEVAEAITTALNKQDAPMLLQKQDESGRCIMYELTLDWTNEFEEQHKGFDWGGDITFFEAIDEFCEAKIYGTTK